MQFHFFQLFIWSIYILVIEQLGFKVVEESVIEQENSLVLVHVLFRHGNRTANGPEELYPKDPYLHESYFPFGLGQLTNAGKIKEYKIGKALRQKYNDFLGPYYYPEMVDAWSTNYNRTKASLELVLAGLFPPHSELIWNEDLLWQPVPYNYLPKSEDKILLGVICPYYMERYYEHIASEKHKALLSQNEEIFQYLSDNTGLNVTNFLDVYNLYFGLSTEEEWGFELPEWTKEVWPQKIIDLTIQEYFAATATTEMVQLASGYLLEKIITDTIFKINNPDSDRKIYLYSAHENNVAELLITLGLFEPVHVPNYGSYIVLEVHKIGDEYGIKIYYENYVEDEPQLLQLPACDVVCELNKFVSLVEEYIPTEDLCNKQAK